MENTFTNKIKSLNNVDKIISMNYFNKFEAVTNLLEIVLSKKKIIRNGFGNYNAKVVIVVEFNNTSDPIIDLIKKYYSKNNRNFYSIYITPLSKFEDKVIDMKVLMKELQLINPKRIISLGIDLPNASSSLSIEDLNEIKQYLKDKSNETTTRFENARDNLVKCITFAMNGDLAEGVKNDN